MPSSKPRPSTLPSHVHPRGVTALASAALVVGLFAGTSACSDGTATTDGTDEVGDCAAALARGQLVITEIMPDPAGADDANTEWFELYNASDEVLSLHEIGLEYSKIDGTSGKGHLIKDENLTIAPGAYMVFGKALEDTLPAHVNYGYGADLGSMGNTSGKIRVVCGTVVIDEALYEKPKDGFSRSLGPKPPDAERNDDLGNWCLATEPYNGKDHGTPGGENPDCPLPEAPVGRCYDGDELRDVITPEPGDLTITEFHPDPDALQKRGGTGSEPVGEWIEVFASRAVDLNGTELGNRFVDGKKHTIAADKCIHIPANAYALLARAGKPYGADDDPLGNGGLPTPDYEYGALTLGNSSGSGVFIGLPGVLLDAVDNYQKPPVGTAWQLSPACRDPECNDDWSQWCAATNTYGVGDFGTPRAVNDACPVAAQAGTCIDETGEPRPINYFEPGELIVTEIFVDPNVDNASTTLGEWIEILAGAPRDLNGLTVGKTLATLQNTYDDPQCHPVAAGDHILVARSDDTTVNGDLPAVDWLAPKMALTNTNSTLVIGVDVVRDADTTDRIELDAISWTSTTKNFSRQLPVELYPANLPFDTTSNDDPSTWCNGNQVFGTGGLGTPRAENLSCDDVPVDPTGCHDTESGMSRMPVAPSVGDVIITEFHPDPDALQKSPGGAAEPVGEWVELFVAADFDLNGLQLGNAFDAGTKHTVTHDDCIPVSAGSFVVLARNNANKDPDVIDPNDPDPYGNGGLFPDYEYAGLTLTNSGGSVSIAISGMLLDDVNNYTKPAVGKAWQLGSDTPCLDGHPLDPACNDDFSLWCPATEQYGLGDFGTPAASNGVCGGGGGNEGQCFDTLAMAMRPLNPPAPGDLVITEFMANPDVVTDANGEWFEVTVLADVDLNNLKLFGSANVTPEALAAANPAATMVSANCLAASAGTQVLFARKSDPEVNGGLPPVQHTFGFNLGNASGGITLGLGDVSLHHIGWTTNQAGDTAKQLSPDQTTTEHNNADIAPWCTAPGMGSPGQPNAVCE